MKNIRGVSVTKHGRHVVVRRPSMNHDRQAVLGSEFQLRRERRALFLARRIVVMVVQSRLAYGYDMGIVERCLDLGRDFRIPCRCFMRMHPGSCGEIETQCECDGLLGGRLRIRDDDNVADTGVTSPLHHFGSIVVELFGAEVAVCID